MEKKEKKIKEIIKELKQEIDKKEDTRPLMVIGTLDKIIEQLVEKFEEDEKLKQKRLILKIEMVELFDEAIKQKMLLGRINKQMATGRIIEDIAGKYKTKNSISKKIMRARNIKRLFDGIGKEKVKFYTHGTKFLENLVNEEVRRIINEVNRRD